MALLSLLIQWVGYAKQYLGRPSCKCVCKRNKVFLFRGIDEKMIVKVILDLGYSIGSRNS